MMFVKTPRQAKRGELSKYYLHYTFDYTVQLMLYFSIPLSEDYYTCLGIYNTEEDIDSFFTVLDEIYELFRQR